MRRLLLFFAIIIAVMTTAMAQGQYLVLTQADGTVSKFLLADQPVITFSEGNLVVTCGSETLTTAMAGLTTSFEDITTAIHQIEESKVTTPKISFGEASFEGLKAGSSVSAYALDGRVLATTKADEEGRANIQLSGLGQGMVILRTSSHSYKITTK